MSFGILEHKTDETQELHFLILLSRCWKKDRIAAGGFLQETCCCRYHVSY